MATTDISRAAFDPRKHYASVRMQQGRVILDDDWNENERIAAEDQRQGRVDIIGPAGSPDTGFRISNPTLVNKQINFAIEDGTFYVSGLRLEMEKIQSYRSQTDWLQWPGDQQDGPTADRVDLVYLEVYQYPVSAVEDSELFEVALGGPDTSTRLRTAQRVHILKNVKPDCCVAWGEWMGKAAGKLNERNELVPDTTLQVTFKPGGNPKNLCTPHVAGGYLGAENQAIRVQLTGKNTLTWGFDNASPLYRVRLDATRKKVTMLTDPKDQAHWPLSGQTVEILPWSAVLPNGQKIADVQGHLSSVDAAYNPNTDELTLKSAVPTAGFDDYGSRPDKADLEKGGVYYYMRVWDRGEDTTSSAEIAFTTGTPVDLGHTGLQVTITGSDRKAGDYWIIAARPETPNEVVPWDFKTGRRPHGVRRFYAPLALIQWKLKDGALESTEVRDCRPMFRPLTQQQCCCRYTVGDGRTSHGHFDLIEEALKHLPSEGGQLCLLPGDHRANVRIKGMENVTISGCEKQTRVSPRSEHLKEPIFEVIDSRGITLEGMDLLAVDGTAIELKKTKTGPLREIEIRHNRILAYQHAIRVKDGQEIYIHHNKIRMLDKEDGDVAIYLLADDSVIERNDIGVVPAKAKPPDWPDWDFDLPTDPCANIEDFYKWLWYLLAYLNFIWNYAALTVPSDAFKTLGGIQIAAGSDRVTLLENQICGGAGNGVTLGTGLDTSALPDRDTEEASEERKNTIKSSQESVIEGEVYTPSGELVTGAMLYFRDTSSGTYHSAVTDEKGYFKAVVGKQRGNFNVSVAGRKVTGIDPIGTRYIISVSEAEKVEEKGIEPSLAFLYEIRIEGNEIVGMGLSGIGVPHISAKDIKRLQASTKHLGRSALLTMRRLAQFTQAFGGFAVNLEIYRNHITGCLQNTFDAEMEARAKRRGMGGISLGLCENLSIRENRIEGNGQSCLDPVCGIFVTCAAHAEVGHNRIVDNGPLTFSGSPSDLGEGMRGGVVLALVTSHPIVALLSTKDEEETASETTSIASSIAESLALSAGRQAARVQDNLVEQPVGVALAVNALGPICVVNNIFKTTFADPKSLLAGAVMIANVGKPSYAQSDDKRLGQSNPYLPNGNTLFNDNQICLATGNSLFSIAIDTTDDLGFDGNQSEVLAGLLPWCNTALQALTLRAGGNRFKEPIAWSAADAARISLISNGWFVNNTTNNQGDHCIVPVSVATSPITTGNQVLSMPVESCLNYKRIVQALAIAIANATLKKE